MKLKNGSQNIRMCLPIHWDRKILFEIERPQRLGNSNQDGFPKLVLKKIIIILCSPLEYRHKFIKSNLELFLTLRRKSRIGPHECKFRERPHIFVQITDGVICESVQKDQR